MSDSHARACIGLVMLAMAAQLFIKIHRYAVDILFSDQWDLYNPLFRGYGVWQSFTQLHGPARLGVGTLVTQAVAMATGWSTRAEAFVVGFIMLLTAIAAVYLKWRLFRKLTAWDALIPMICLSVPQSDGPIVVPFPSYSAVPLLLLILYCICLTCRNGTLRYGLLSLLNFLLVFSHWGIFVGMLTPCLLGYEVLRHSAARDSAAKRQAGFAFVLSVCSLGLFFVHYKFSPAVDCFNFPHRPLLDYAWFIADMFSYSAGMPFGYYAEPLTRYAGSLLVLGVVAVLADSFRKLSRDRMTEPLHLITVLFIAFSLLFAMNAAVGRVCIGAYAASAARYQALLSPAWLGLYFAAAGLESDRLRAGAGVTILALCFLVPQSKNDYYEGNLQYYSDVKRTWAACYLEGGNAAACDAEAGCSIYTPIPSSEAQDRLDFLKQRHLNFFADQ